MASEGIENFQAIVTSLAGVGASVAAWMGLHAWKDQQRWQHGRTIATDLLRSFHQVEQQVNSARYSLPEYRIPLSSDTELDQATFLEKARQQRHREQLVSSLGDFDRAALEAFVAWNIDLRSTMIFFRETYSDIGILFQNELWSIDKGVEFNSRAQHRLAAGKLRRKLTSTVENGDQLEQKLNNFREELYEIIRNKKLR